MNLIEEKKSCSSKGNWTCAHSGQVWSGLNQMKNVKHAANWATRALVEKCHKVENTSIFA
jgi:hypothetical protein